MWKLDSNYNITMTRGDTPSFELKLTTTDSTGAVIPYDVKDDDVIIFAVKEQNGTTVLINIEVPHDTLILKIPQEQTEYLGYDTYIYEISINNDSDDFHCTFIDSRKLTLCEEVY